MTMETSSLSIQIKSQGIVEATKALSELSKAASSVDKETRAFILAQGKSEVASARASIAAAKVQTELANQERITAKLTETQARSAEVVERALQRQEAAVQRVTSQAELHSGVMNIQRLSAEKLQQAIDAKNKSLIENAERLKNTNNSGSIFNNTLRSMTTAALAYMSVNFVGGLFKEADGWAMMQSKLSLAVGSMELAKVVQNDLFEMSQRLRVPLEDTVKLYTRMITPLQKMGKTTAEAKVVVESFSTALKLAGATGQEASSAMLQFSQSINAGRLNGGEFNSVAEAAPNVLRAIEAELIRTGRGAELASKQLKGMSKEGLLTTDLLTRALTNAAPQWRKDFESLPFTVDGALTRIKNAWQKTLGEIGLDTKFNENMANAMKGLEELIPTVAKAVVTAISFMVEHGGQLLTVFTSIAAVFAFFKFAVFVEGLVAATAATVALSAGAGALGTTLAVVLKGFAAIGISPVGAALLAIGAAVSIGVFAWAAMTESIDKNAKAKDEINKRTGEVVSGIQAESLALELQIDKLRVARDEQEKYNTSKQKGGVLSAETDIEELKRGLIWKQKALEAAKVGATRVDKSGNTYITGTSVSDTQKEIDTQLRMIALAEAAKRKLVERTEEFAHDLRTKDAKDYATKVAADALTDNQKATEVRRVAIKEADEKYAKLGLSLAVHKQDLLNIEKKYQDSLDKQKKIKLEKSHGFMVKADEGDDNDPLIKNMLLFQKAQEKKAEGYKRAAEGAEAELQKQKDLLETYGKTAGEIEKLQVIRLEDQVSRRAELKLTDSMVESLQREITAKKESAGIKAQIEAKDDTAKSLEESQKILDKMMDTSKVDKFSTALTNGMKGAAGAFIPLIKALDAYSAAQSTLTKEYNALEVTKKKGFKTSEEKALFDKEQSTFDKKTIEYRLSAYGNMAGAAKGFFKEGTEGYKTMATVEKIFRATELANTIYNSEIGKSVISAVSSLFISSKAAEAGAEEAWTMKSVAMSGLRATADGVAGVAKAIASMPFPLNLAAGAATIAALMAIGVKISGGAGNGSVDMTKQRQESAGKGSVLGDSNAKSESISKSLELMSKLSQNQLFHTASMDNSLKLIVNNISGLANVVVKSGAIGDAAKGIKTGSTINTGSAILGTGLMTGGVGLVVAALGKQIPFIGNLLTKLFGNTTTVLDQGIKVMSVKLADIDKLRANSYADVNTTKKFLGFTTSNKTTEQLSALPKEITDQFSLIITSMADGIKNAAGVIGLSGDAFQNSLSNFVVDIGNISTKGLTGDQIQKQFETIFSKIGDDMAKAVLITGETVEVSVNRFTGNFKNSQWLDDGLDEVNNTIKVKTIKYVSLIEEFSKIGEGAFETLMRVAGSLTVVNETFDLLGMKTYGVGLEGIKASEGLLKFVGGIEKFRSVTQSYYDNFYTDAEKTTKGLAQVKNALTRLGVTEDITTREAFRARVEKARLDGDDKLALSLMGLGEAFASVVKWGDEANKTVTSAATKRGLEIQIMELLGNKLEALAANREIELSGLDDSAKALQHRIYALTDEKNAIEEAKAAQEAATAELNKQAEAAKAIAKSRSALEIQIMELSGQTVTALNIKRQLELAEMDASLQPLQMRINALQDEKTQSEVSAAYMAKVLASEKAEADERAKIASSRAKLEIDILNLLGNTSEATARQRSIELAAMDASLRPLQERIYSLTDEKLAQDKAVKAAEEAAAKAKTVAEAKSKMELEILTLGGMSSEAVAMQRLIEINALDDALKPLQDTIWALQDQKAAQELANKATEEAAAKAKAIAESRAKLEIDILNLTGNTAEATARQRAIELETMDVSLRPLQQRIWALQDEKTASEAATVALNAAADAARSIANERANLDKQLLQLQGNTTKLRELEKGALYNSNQALQQSIYDLQDKQAADAKQAQAAQEWANAVQAQMQKQAEAAAKLRESYKSLSTTMIEEANRIMGIVTGNTPQSLAAAQANFDITTAQARAGDTEAAKSLPELAKALLLIGEGTLRTTDELRYLQGVTAGSLRTTGMGYDALDNLPSFDVGTDYVPHDMIAQIHKGERIVPAAYNKDDTSGLKEEIASLRSILSSIATNTNSIEKSSKDTNSMFKRVTQDGEAIITTPA